MPAASDRLEFAPPPQPALIRSAGLALLAHLLLLGALTWGINWKRKVENDAIEAELWRSVPQAAPRAEEPPPPPPPPPQAEPQRPPPAPEPPRAAPAPEPDRADAIALEREKKRRLEEQREREAEQQRREREKRAELKKREAEKAEQERRVAEERRKAEAAREKVAQRAREAASAQEAKRSEDRRREAIERTRRLAGEPSDPGGPARELSANYVGRIRALIKRSINYPNLIPGSPVVEVEVRAAPDGTIIGQRITKPSGSRAWDEAVLRGISAAERLPRDEEGKVPSPIVLTVQQ